VLVCDRVKVPWERVFLHNNGAVEQKSWNACETGAPFTSAPSGSVT